MKEAFIKLHISILLAGFTGIFGKLITLNEGMLVWYRMLFTSVIFFFILWASRKLHRVSLRDFTRIGATGFLLCLHWIFFYGSIKTSNVSIGVVCFSLVGFFTAILEPLINRRRISVRELAYSCITLCGIVLIFSFDIRYRLGIALGVVSSILAALFTITNKGVGAGHDSGTMLLYEMTGGFICLSCLMPVYLYFFPVETFFPGWLNFFYLILFVLFCTIGLYILQIQVLKSISAFTMNLTYNLEPVYSIILAMILFGEAKELGYSFYAGLGLIILSVVLQMFSVLKKPSPPPEEIPVAAESELLTSDSFPDSK